MDATLKVLEHCRKNGVRRLVFSSSSSVYGDAEMLPTDELCPICPMSPYALQKLVGEQYCKLYSTIYGLETVCLRYFNVYGDLEPKETLSLIDKAKSLGWNPIRAFADDWNCSTRQAKNPKGER